jgi:hypothetical protein
MGRFGIKKINSMKYLHSMILHIFLILELPEEAKPKLYLLPPNLPVYNPTPISELERRKIGGDQLYHRERI